MRIERKPSNESSISVERAQRARLGPVVFFWNPLLSDHLEALVKLDMQKQTSASSTVCATTVYRRIRV